MGGGFGLACYYLPIIKNPRACLRFWTPPAKIETSTKHGAVITRLDIWPTLSRHRTHDFTKQVSTPCHNQKPLRTLKIPVTVDCAIICDVVDSVKC